MTETGSGIVYDGVADRRRRGADRRRRRGTDGHAGPRGGAGSGPDGVPGLPGRHRSAGRDGGWYPTGDAGRLDPTARSRSSGASPRSSSPAGRRCGRSPVEQLLAGHPGVGRLRCGSGPTPSGANGWWPGWCQRPRGRPRPSATSAPWWPPVGALGRSPGAGAGAGLPRTPSGKVRTGRACPDVAGRGRPEGSAGQRRRRGRDRRWRCTGHHRR